jgi:hypothetical protein
VLSDTADDAMTDSDTEGDASDEANGPDKTAELRSVYLSVTDGETDPVVESQRTEPGTRTISDEPDGDVVGPAEHHGLDDAIGDPEPDG